MKFCHTFFVQFSLKYIYLYIPETLNVNNLKKIDHNSTQHLRGYKSNYMNEITNKNYS